MVSATTIDRGYHTSHTENIVRFPVSVSQPWVRICHLLKIKSALGAKIPCKFEMKRQPLRIPLEGHHLFFKTVASATMTAVFVTVLRAAATNYNYLHLYSCSGCCSFNSWKFCPDVQDPILTLLCTPRATLKGIWEEYVFCQ